MTLKGKLDCGDNSCVYAYPKTGMRTNGGCCCVQKLFDKNVELEAAILRLLEAGAGIKDHGVLTDANEAWDEAASAAKGVLSSI